MPPLSLDEFYAEQDEHMNMPDEPVEDYVKRISAHRLSTQSPNVIFSSSSRLPGPHTTILPETLRKQTLDPIMAPTTTIDETTPVSACVETGRSKKRRGIDDSDFLQPGPSRRQKISDPDNQDSDCVVGDLRQSIPPSILTKDILHTESTDLHKDSKIDRQVSPTLDDIDSFTIDDYGTPISPLKKGNQRNSHTQDTRQITVNKPRSIQARSPQIPAASTLEPMSPILSFSKSVDLSPKRPNRGATNAPPPKKPRLDMCLESDLLQTRKPVKVNPRPSTSRRDPSTSPIEDAGLLKPSKKTQTLGTASSSLFLEIKERIAKHSGPKMDKVMKFPKKLVSREPSVSEVAAQPDNTSFSMRVSSSPSAQCSSPTTKKITKETNPKKSETKEAKTPNWPVEKRKPGKGKKEKRSPIMPADFVRELRMKFQEASLANPGFKHPRSKFLEGKNIFYTGGDMNQASEQTRRKMTIIMECGANLMPEYDPEVTTHIITDAPSAYATLQALKLKTLRQIPAHIPTMTWGWVLTVLDRKHLTREEIDTRLQNAIVEYTPYAERIDLGFEPPKPRVLRASFSKPDKGKHRASSEKVVENGIETLNNSSADPFGSTAINTADSSTSRHSQDVHHPKAPISPPTSPIRGTWNTSTSREASSVPIKDDDPLAEFYDQARKQKNLEDGWSSVGEIGDTDDDETDDEPNFKPIPRFKKGWTCDNKQTSTSGDCPNQGIIDKLNQLMELHKIKGGDEDRWRVTSYSKTIRALRNHPIRIRSGDEARRLHGVGEKTAQKIDEIIKTGDLQRIKYENTKDIEVTRLFQGIYGVGRSIAFQWYQAGCRTLDDLKAGKGGVKLTIAQSIGLRYYDDINSRMPREEARAIFELIKPIALSIDPKLSVQIMGSYRRGKADCGDIDILITRPTDDGSTHAGVLPRLLRKLHASNILTEDLALPDDPEDLEATYRGLCHLPNVQEAKQRRIDFLTTPWTSRGAALLYYTGDDIFNRAIRLKANVMGYSLNQKGLFGNVVRDPRDKRVKLTSGVLIASETEEKIFEILKVPWQEPHERVRG